MIQNMKSIDHIAKTIRAQDQEGENTMIEIEINTGNINVIN
jgi:hypothetical protein